MHADEDVLQGGHVGEQPDVLERPADAGYDHVVGTGALEDPEPYQQPGIPRRSDDGRDQGRDEQTEAHQDQDLDLLRAAARGRGQVGQAPGKEGWQDPQDGLEPAAFRRSDDPLPQELHLPGGRLVESGDYVEERGLAGAVGPDEASYRALPDFEVDASDGDESAESFRESHGAQDRGCRLVAHA